MIEDWIADEVVEAYRNEGKKALFRWDFVTEKNRFGY